MKREKTGLATVLFVIGILLAGLANAASKLVNIKYNESQGAFTEAPFLSTLMFCLNLAIYIFLLVFWLHSVQRRLLPSRSRFYLIAAAVCAIALLTLRSIKYRMIDLQAYEANRYLWYFYYVPMILLPTLFLMTCVNIERKNKPGKFDERLLLIPASILIILILTNDIHHLAFLPNGDTAFISANGYYKNNVLFYVYYAYYVVMIAAGLVLLIRANHRLHSIKKAVLPFLFLLIMLGLVLVDKTLSLLIMPSMFAAPEIVSFGMIGIFESCVRNRLIPYNENYAGFFASMRFPAIITQSDFTVAHRSASPISAEIPQLKASLEKPLYLDKDTKLTGKPVTAGFAFYTEDERELHRMIDRLIDANELIASENDLIEAENILKMRQAQVDSRNMIYAEITEKMLPYHRRALEMLDEMQPGADDFYEKLARLNLLNAYIKRGTNLLLVSDGGKLPSRELRMALEESALYLGYCGVKASVSSDGEKTLTAEAALELYTAFQTTADALLGSVTMLHIALNGDQLRLTADCERLPEQTLPADVMENDGLTFFIITCGKGGAV